MRSLRPLSQFFVANVNVLSRLVASNVRRTDNLAAVYIDWTLRDADIDDSDSLD